MDKQLETNINDKEIDSKELDKVVGGYTVLKLATAPITFQALKIDPRLGDKLVNGACDCCKWEPAIV